MKKIYFLFFTLLSLSGAMAQGCLPEGITFATQAQIDNFQIDYPGCTIIDGDVTINGPEISNLNGLSLMTAIEGSIYIYDNYLLTSITGLNNISRINGYVDISYNDALASFNGLNNLDSIGGGISFYANMSLISLSGLNSLVYIGESLGIEWCNELNSLDGLENLAYIGGNLDIGFNQSLTDLTELSNLTTIDGDLYIFYNNSLNSLAGLNNIVFGATGNLSIHDNSSLSDCNVESFCSYLVNPVGQVNIYNNAAGCNNPREVAGQCGISLPCLPFGNYYATSQSEVDNFELNYSGCFELYGSLVINGDNITNLAGLNHLTSINGSLVVESNDSLINFTGLDSLGHIGGSFQVGFFEGNENPVLIDFTGLGNLRTIGGYLEVLLCDSLKSFNGLDRLSSTGGLSVGNNSALTSLGGLDSLKSINEELLINDNDLLVNLSGLDNLVTVGNSINIGFNASLRSLAGLDNIDSGSVDFLHITDNTSLSECNVLSVCNYLANPNANIIINNNAPRCNTPEEVEAACLDVSVNMISDSKELKLYPNPASGYIYIEISESSKDVQLNIVNMGGQLVLNQYFSGVSTVVNISQLPAGLYFVKLTGNQGVQVGKFVKE